MKGQVSVSDYRTPFPTKHQLNTAESKGVQARRKLLFRISSCTKICPAPVTQGFVCDAMAVRNNQTACRREFQTEIYNVRCQGGSETDSHHGVDIKTTVDSKQNDVTNDEHKRDFMMIDVSIQKLFQSLNTIQFIETFEFVVDFSIVSHNIVQATKTCLSYLQRNILMLVVMIK